MLRRTLLFISLAGLGFLSDRAIQGILCARRLGEVGQDLRSAATSPDGRYVAGLRSEGQEKWSVTVWETSSGRVVLTPQTLPHPPASTNGLAWHENNRQLAVGSSDEVSLFDIANGSRKRLQAEWLVRDVRFSGDRVFARCDNTVFVWDSSTGKLRLKLNQGRLLAGAISAPAGVVAAASHEDSIRVYNLADGKFLRALPAGPATVGLDFVNDGQWLATGFRFMRARDRDCAIIYDWKAGRALTPQLSHPNFAGYSVSANGHRLITRDDLRCRVWDGASGKLILEHPLACPTIDSLSADGRMVASMTRESDDVLIWRPDTGQEFCRLHHRTRPYGFRFFSTDMAQVLHGGCSVWQVTPPR